MRLKKGVLPVIPIAVLVVLAILLVSGSKLQDVFSPAAILTQSCVSPGGITSVITDPMTVTAASTPAYYCTTFCGTHTNGLHTCTSQCSNIGAVVAGQTLPGRSITLAIPAALQPNQGINIYNFVSKIPAIGTYASTSTSPDIAMFTGRISGFDNIFMQIKSSCPGAVSSGERTVNYFLKCDNTDANQGKLEICTREAYSGLSTSCKASSYYPCNSGEKCVASSDGKYGTCAPISIPQTCGREDNACPGYNSRTNSSSICQPYQDRDCCFLAGGDWAGISFGGIQCSKGDNKISTWASASNVDPPNFFAIITGAAILGVIITVLLFGGAFLFPPLRVILLSFMNIRGFVLVAVVISIMLAILFTGMAVSATALIPGGIPA